MSNGTKLFTIGFTKKNARTFFELLKTYGINRLIDIRLNNVSQLAGFTKKDDLEYFLKTICNIEYLHIVSLSPTDELLRKYKMKIIDWDAYEREFNELLRSRKPEDIIGIEKLANSCFLCSEPTSDKCHRRLVAEYYKKIYPEIEIIHI